MHTIFNPIHKSAKCNANDAIPTDRSAYSNALKKENFTLEFNPSVHNIIFYNLFVLPNNVYRTPIIVIVKSQSARVYFMKNKYDFIMS